MIGQDVRLEDVRQMIRVLGEAAEIFESQLAQSHVLDGLCRVLHARIAMAAVVTGVDRGEFQITRDGCVGISGEEAAALFSPYLSRGTKGDPLLERVMMLPQDSQIRVHRRCELVSDGEWYRNSVIADVRMPMRLDDTMHAYKVHGRGEIIGFQIIRDATDGTFDERDRNLVEFTMLEGGSLLAAGPSPLTAGLTPRQKQILGCLLSGAGEKQVAFELGLSVHTVHDHIKQIYRTFNVTSRAELMAKAVRRRNR
jgi:DNA-binding CsgD family transcriptional regulator